MFLTEQAILQYIGLIRNNMADIEAKRFVGQKRENKLFYQVCLSHKNWCIILDNKAIPKFVCSVIFNFFTIISVSHLQSCVWMSR